MSGHACDPVLVGPGEHGGEDEEPHEGRQDADQDAAQDKTRRRAMPPTPVVTSFIPFPPAEAAGAALCECPRPSPVVPRPASPKLWKHELPWEVRSIHKLGDAVAGSN